MTLQSLDDALQDPGFERRPNPQAAHDFAARFVQDGAPWDQGRRLRNPVGAQFAQAPQHLRQWVLNLVV